ncbi:MAG: rhodanese-like domain-containing protein [Muribaculaceae bacterium]
MTMCISQASGCNNNDIPSVSAPEFEQQIKVDSVQLLDVRTPEEYAEGHIAGAVNIDVQSDDFQPTARQELSKDSTILVYCRSGRRSLDAAEILARLGYRVVNLKGGILDWQASGLPVTTTTDKE